jgi:hypothetical protein
MHVSLLKGERCDGCDDQIVQNCIRFGNGSIDISKAGRSSKPQIEAEMPIMRLKMVPVKAENVGGWAFEKRISAIGTGV